MKLVAFSIACLMLTPGVAAARDYCPERPGLNTPPCIIDSGHVSLETSIADWTRDDTSDARHDQLLIADTFVRIGVTDRAEVQVGWTPFGHDYLRDKPMGMIDRADRVGDVSLGAKLSLINPDGDKLSVALRPEVTLPVGRTPIGAGDWSAGLAAPFNLALNDAISLEATPEIDAAVDQDGHGHHIAYGSAAGIQLDLAKHLNATAELQLIRDDDPAEHATQALAALSFAWQPAGDLQFDVGSAAGLNRTTPDVRLYVGIARRF